MSRKVDYEVMNKEVSEAVKRYEEACRRLFSQAPDKGEAKPLAYWMLKETLDKGQSIEVPSLGIRLNPGGSHSELEQESKNSF